MISALEDLLRDMEATKTQLEGALDMIDDLMTDLKRTIQDAQDRMGER